MHFPSCYIYFTFYHLYTIPISSLVQHLLVYFRNIFVKGIRSYHLICCNIFIHCFYNWLGKFAETDSYVILLVVYDVVVNVHYIAANLFYFLNHEKHHLLFRNNNAKKYSKIVSSN